MKIADILKHPPFFQFENAYKLLNFSMKQK